MGAAVIGDEPTKGGKERMAKKKLKGLKETQGKKPSEKRTSTQTSRRVSRFETKERLAVPRRRPHNRAGAAPAGRGKKR